MRVPGRSLGIHARGPAPSGGHLEREQVPWGEDAVPWGRGGGGALAQDSAPRGQGSRCAFVPRRTFHGHESYFSRPQSDKHPHLRAATARPPARPPGKLSLFTGCLDSLGGSERGVPRQSSDWARGCFYRAELSQEAESRLCLESSLNRNMLNSFLFYQLTASNR